MPELDPFGAEVAVGDVTLRTPGMTGIAEARPPSPGGLRDSADDAGELTAALSASGLTPQEVVVISDAYELPTDYGGTRTAHGEQAIEVDVPGPTQGYEQVVLSTDEAGVVNWHFAGGVVTEGEVRGTTGLRTYRVARRVPAVSGTGVTRNLAQAVGQKVIRVLTYKLAGLAADRIVDRWESAKRPHRLRTFEEANKRDDGLELVGDALRRYSEKRALLLIHGTSSTTAGGFGNMDSELLRQLTQRYEGRILAFDHPSIATGPDTNVRWLLDALPGNGWELDVIAHSRGGLVARALAERGSEWGAGPSRVQVRRVVFLGTPNAGTPLADMDHMQGFVDVFTNMLQLLSIGLPVAATLAGILEVVKQLAAGAVAGLDGLQSMHPEGEYLRSLPADPLESRYFGMASNFEPINPGLLAFKDAVMDGIFGSGAQNDLVVPTAGVADLGSPRGLFPLTDRHEFAAADGVDHSAYVRQPAAIAPILRWLS